MKLLSMMMILGVPAVACAKLGGLPGVGAVPSSGRGGSSAGGGRAPVSVASAESGGGLDAMAKSAPMAQVEAAAAPKKDELVDATSYPPRVVDSSTMVHLAHDGDKNGKSQYKLSLTMNIVGKTEPDDRLSVQLYRDGSKVGKPFECAIKDGDFTKYSYVNDFECTSGDQRLDAAGDYRAEISYMAGGASASGPKAIPWRNVKFQADSSWETLKIKGMRANMDHKLDEGWVAFTGGDEQYLDLVFWSAPRKRDKPGSAAARCFIGDKQIGGTATRLDPDREISVFDGKSEEFLGYTRYSVRGLHVALRPKPRRPGESNATTVYLSQNPGKWECRLNLDGKPTRIWRFTVGADGEIAARTAADKKPIVSPFKLVDIEIKGEYDRPVNRKAMAKYTFFGR